MHEAMSSGDLTVLRFTAVAIAAVMVIMVIGMIRGMRPDRIVVGGIAMVTGALVPSVARVDWAMGVALSLMGLALCLGAHALFKAVREQREKEKGGK